MWRGFFIIAIALAAIAPMASASESVITINGTVVWDTPRHVDQPVVIGNNSSLIIRGVEVEFANVSITVAESGALRVESTPESAAILRGPLRGNWSVTSSGVVDIEGNELHPVLLDHLGGFSGMTNGASAFDGGLTAKAGRLTLSHVTVTEYSAGILVGGRAVGSISHARFSSPVGTALMTVGSPLDVDNTTFVGTGGTVYVSVPSKPASFRDVVFRDTGVALSVNNGGAQLQRLHISNATACVLLYGVANVTVRDSTCAEFTAIGLGMANAPVRKTANGTLEVDGFAVWSNVSTAEAAIKASEPNSLVIRNTTIGPVPAIGITVERGLPQLQNTTFHQVGNLPVYLLAPPPGFSRDVPGSGEPGPAGWVLVAQYGGIRVIDAGGDAVAGATYAVSYASNGTQVLAGEASELGTAKLVFSVLTVDSEGRATDHVYDVHASAPDRGEATAHAYAPDGTLLTIQLPGTAAPRFAGVPATPFAAFLACVAVAALIRRR